MAPASCGIDFGTTNSAVALARDGRKALVPLEDGRTTLPSALFFPTRKDPLFGRAAIDSYLLGTEGRLLRGLKKILGTALMQDKTQLGHRSLSFAAILQIFIAHLKDGAEQACGQTVGHVVMGRPVHFHDNNHAADGTAQDTLRAVAHAVGFTHVEFLYEPIAAAFAHEALVEKEKLALVVDLGGGTSDFTVIRLSTARARSADRTQDILATTGVRVGGTTFDYRLSLQCFMPLLGLGDEYHDSFDDEKWLPMPRAVYQDLSDWPFVHRAQTPQALRQTQDLMRRAADPVNLERLLRVQEEQRGHALLACVEDTKIILTQEADCRAPVSWFAPPDRPHVTRAALEDAIAADTARIMEALADCLQRAGVTADRIELVILTGGSTALPLIQKTIADLFPHAQLSQGNRMDSVGLGLAYHSERLFR
jgi:hypothetical chaperone protein